MGDLPPMQDSTKRQPAVGDPAGPRPGFLASVLRGADGAAGSPPSPTARTRRWPSAAAPPN